MGLQKEFWIKNMVCNRCLKVIKQELEELGVIVLSLELGKLLVEASSKTDTDITDIVTKVLYSNDFEIVQSKDEILVEKIKIILIELLTQLPLHLKWNTSQHLSSILKREYKILSTVFSKNENITIEKYFIKLINRKSKRTYSIKTIFFFRCGIYA